jgi:hypothetical protein
MDNFDLKKYLAEGRLFEEDTNIPDNILKLIAKTVKQPVDKVEKVVTGEEKVTEEELNEGIILTSVTILSLIPVAMEAIGGLSNWIARNTGKSKAEIAQIKKFNAEIEEKEELIKTLDKRDSKREFKERELLKKLIEERDDIWGSDFGQWMKTWGHKLHKAYVWPIKKLLQGIAFFQKKDSKLKDPKFREKIANILYAITMASVAGIGILSHLGHLSGVGPVLITIADGVKEGKSITDIAKGISLFI